LPKNFRRVVVVFTTRFLVQLGQQTHSGLLDSRSAQRTLNHPLVVELEASSLTSATTDIPQLPDIAKNNVN
jgi:hypothetical protein